MRQGTVAQLARPWTCYRAAGLGLRGPVHRPRQPRRKAACSRQRGTGRRRGVGIALSVVADDACTKGQSIFLVMRPESITLVPEKHEAPEGEATAVGIVRSRTFPREKSIHGGGGGTSLHA